MDCEAFDGGLLAQQVNAWSSLAYVVVGVALVALVRHQRLAGAFVALGVATAAEGVGSLLYHGRPGDVAQFLHDAPLAAIIGFVGGWHVGRLGMRRVARPDSAALSGLGIAAAVASVLFLVGLNGSNVIIWIGVAAIVAAEVAARRRGHAAVWRPALLVLVAVSGAAWLAGSTASPLCDPDSLLQPHALWHVLSALAILAWARSAGTTTPRLSRR